MATEQQALAAKVDRLRIAVEALAGQIDEKVQTKVETEVAAKGVPREEYKRRVRASGKRTVAALLFLLLAIVAAFVWNRVTLTQAQDLAIGDFRRLIATCRTTGPPLSPDDLTFCERRIKGFSQLRARALETAATAKRNQERLDRVERELAKLLE